MEQDLKTRITIDPQKRSGKPCIIGTRITVYDIFSQLSSGRTYDDILYDYPYLTKEDLLSCFEFVASINSPIDIQILRKLQEDGWQFGDALEFNEDEYSITAGGRSIEAIEVYIQKVRKTLAENPKFIEIINKSRKSIENSGGLSKEFIKKIFK